MRKVLSGSPWPLGSSITSRGVNFSLAAPKAKRIELLLFKKNQQKPIEIIPLKEQNRSGDYWHIEIEGLKAGCIYAYRVFENCKNTKRNSSNIELIDPCARAIIGWNNYLRNKKSENIDKENNNLKGVVCERNKFNFNSHPRPKHPWTKTIIYELHIKGFTKNTNIELEKKGTFLGLINKIPYLKSLGITTIELLPVFAFDTSDSPKGLNNYWGYSPINWFTPHQDFVADEDPLSARDQFRKLVEACHDNGLEVLIDVVYNHTTEAGENGPCLSWKGFGDSFYYHQDKSGNFQDVTGCGNTIAANRPLVRNLIIESMRCWALELGVDGFRFDLGISLSRGDDLKPLDKPPIFEDIEADPQLSDLKLISEPWDCGGLYRLSDFPAKRFRTWNGHFRDDIRKFWKGDKNTTWPLKDRLIGNPCLYEKPRIAHEFSINFITSHDGFTLNDLVTYNVKHNLANGESNRDGENHNNNWNHGIEGPCSNKKIIDLRKRQRKNLLSSLILSPGIPMILMGDEVGRSQGGNNNTWCQDNILGWMIWDPADCDLDLKRFVSKLILIRKSLPELFSPSYIHESSPKNPDLLLKDFWLEWHGVKINQPDWSSWSHTISYSINLSDRGSVMWLGLNAYKEPMEFALPSAISPWKKIIDTSSSTTKGIPKKPISNQNKIKLESRSLVLLLANEFSNKLKFKIDF